MGRGSDGSPRVGRGAYSSVDELKDEGLKVINALSNRVKASLQGRPINSEESSNMRDLIRFLEGARSVVLLMKGESSRSNSQKDNLWSS